MITKNIEVDAKRLNGSRRADFPGLSLLLTLIGCAVLFYALFRAEPFPNYFSSSDKVGHFLAFCLMIVVVRGAFYTHIHFSLILIPLLTLAVCSELLQASEWLPYRTYSVEDIAANVSGLLVGLCLSIWLLGNSGNQHKSHD